MLTFMIAYWVDVVLFAAIAIAGAGCVHRWLRRAGHGGLPRRGWATVAATIALAIVGTEVADGLARRHMRDRLEGFAPTYAQEIELMGHAGVSFDTPADAPNYLKMVNAELRWEKVNTNVSDIYTYRRKPDGSIALVVDSETDYDRNGKFEGDREQRTAIGEDYPDPPENFAKALDGVAAFDGEPYTDRWGTWISAYVPLRDKNGRVEAALGVDYNARLWNQDVMLNRLSALGIVGVLLATMTAGTTLLTVSRSELAKRTALQRQLIDASRQAGMAEVATGVLHNVGNVLNSVNVTARTLAEKVRGSKVAGLNRAADLIRAHPTDFADFVANDAKGRVLPDYIVKLSDMLLAEQQDTIGELGGLTRNIDHVKQIVASQQTMAKAVDVTESLELSNLVEDAVSLARPAIDRSGARIEWVKSACPHLTTDRHAVLQILVNLLTNAAKAVADQPERRLTVRINADKDADGTDVARVAICDSGVGISADDLKKLFTHGFTTRQDGHGFGLHHSANAAHTLGGRLTAASDGVGYGATFTLTLPLTATTKGAPCPA